MQNVDNMTDEACAVMLNGGELEVRAQAKAKAEANIQKELQGKKENCTIYFQNYFQNSNLKRLFLFFRLNAHPRQGKRAATQPQPQYNYPYRGGDVDFNPFDFID